MKILSSVFAVAVLGGLIYAYLSNNGIREKQSEDSEEQVDVKKDKPVKEEVKADEDKGTKKEEPSLEGKAIEKEQEEKEKHEKKDGKVVAEGVGFTITDSEVNDKIKELPDQIISRMSLKEIRTFVTWQLVYEKVMTDVAKNSGVGKDAVVRDAINKRKSTVAGALLLQKEVEKAMTKGAVKAHYDDKYEKEIKGKKEVSLIAITTTDKNVASKLKPLKNEEEVRKIIASNPANTKSMDLNDRLQDVIPPEILGEVLAKGAGNVVGPFDIRGTHMVFFVKKIDDAKKKDFNDEMYESYKQVAMRDFAADTLRSLYKKNNVRIFDVDKKEIDPFEIAKKNEKAETNQKDLTAKLAKLKDEDVVASMDGKQLTVKDVKEYFKVTSLLDPTFVAMAQQFGIPVSEVIAYATKLIVDDWLLSQEVERLKYNKDPDVVEKLKEVENKELQHAYFKVNIKVNNSDVKLTFNEYMESIPEEDKNDNEISVKLVFFDTSEDASSALKSISAGEKKFGDLYKEKTSSDVKDGVDLGYIKKRGTPPELWTLLKKGASGACCKEVVEIDGSQFGLSGKNYALVFIADRRPVTLPSLSNEQEKKYFQAMAERKAAVVLAKKHIATHAKTIDGVSVETALKNPASDNMLQAFIGYAR
jgi:hypothetical protein